MHLRERMLVGLECRSVPGLVPTGWHLPDLWHLFVDDFDIEVRNKPLDRTYLVDELSGGHSLCW